jgi:protein translocase SEC61 complex gamma subunit
MQLGNKLRSFITNARHILYVSYKPGEERFKRTAKIVILGIILAGVLGLVIAIIISLLVTGSLALV